LTIIYGDKELIKAYFLSSVAFSLSLSPLKQPPKKLMEMFLAVFLTITCLTTKKYNQMFMVHDGNHRL